MTRLVLDTDTTEVEKSGRPYLVPDQPEPDEAFFNPDEPVSYPIDTINSPFDTSVFADPKDISIGQTKEKEKMSLIDWLSQQEPAGFYGPYVAVPTMEETDRRVAEIRKAAKKEKQPLAAGKPESEEDIISLPTNLSLAQILRDPEDPVDFRKIDQNALMNRLSPEYLLTHKDKIPWLMKKIAGGEEEAKNLMKQSLFVADPEKAKAMFPNDPLIIHFTENPEDSFGYPLFEQKLYKKRRKEIEGLREMTREQRKKHFQSKGEITTEEFFGTGKKEGIKDIREYMLFSGILKSLKSWEYKDALDRLQEDNYKYDRNGYSPLKAYHQLIVQHVLLGAEEIQDRGMTLPATLIDSVANLVKYGGEIYLLAGIAGGGGASAPTTQLGKAGLAAKMAALNPGEVANLTIKRTTDKGRIGDEGEFIKTEEGQSLLKALPKSFVEQTVTYWTEQQGEIIGKHLKKIGGKILDKLPKGIASMITKSGKLTKPFYDMLQKGKLDGMIPEFAEEYLERIIKPILMLDDQYRDKSQGYLERVAKSFIPDGRELLVQTLTFSIMPIGGHIAGPFMPSRKGKQGPTSEPSSVGTSSNKMQIPEGRAKTQLLARIDGIAKNTIQNTNYKDKIAYHKISDKEAATLKEKIGLYFKDFEHLIDSDFIRHVLKRHGNPKVETKQGQIAVTIDDFSLVPDIIKNPDTIEKTRTRLGLDAITYSKRFNGTIYFVEEVRTGKKVLAAKTMYKKNARAPFAAVEKTGPQLTSETFPGTNIIKQRPADVKGKTIAQEQSYEQGYLSAMEEKNRPPAKVRAPEGRTKTQLLARIDDIAKNSLSDRKYKDKIVYYKIDAEEAKQLKTELGLDLQENDHHMDSDFMRHSLKQHGDPITEAQRGQVAITIDDFKLIPDIIKNPDSRKIDKISKQGLVTIKYTKRFNGTIYFFEEVRTGKKVLAAKTMYKKKARAHHAAAGKTGPLPTSETLPGISGAHDDAVKQPPGPNVRNDTGIKNIIKQKPQDVKKNVEQYKKANPDNVVSVDRARRVLEGYDPKDISNERKYYAQAGEIAGRAYDDWLKTRKGKGNNVVLFLAGGNGSGKSTVVDSIPGQQEQAIVVDSTLSNRYYADKQIDQAIEAGYQPEIWYVYREPADAWENGIWQRYEEGEHFVEADSFLNTHLKSRQNVLDIAEKYGDKVNIRVFENITGKKSKEITLDQLKQKQYNVRKLKGQINEISRRQIQKHPQLKGRKEIFTSGSADSPGRAGRSQREVSGKAEKEKAGRLTHPPSTGENTPESRQLNKLAKKIAREKNISHSEALRLAEKIIAEEQSYEQGYISAMEEKDRPPASGKESTKSVEITGNEIPLVRSRKANIGITKRYGKKLRGVYKNEDTGWDINLFMDGINDTVHHARKKHEFQAVAALPELIKKAKKVRTIASTKPEYRKAYVFEAPLKIGNDLFQTKMVVLERYSGVKEVIEERLYNLKTKRPAKALAGVEPEGPTVSAQSGSSNNIIDKKPPDVKGKLKRRNKAGGG